ncbi:MAG TPA: CHAT domain-containing protein, partial [Pyrinomonadaceae bacterium]
KEAAANTLLSALALSEQANYVQGQAQALLTLSDLQNYDNHVLALETAQKALKLWQTLDDRRLLAHAYSQVGGCYLAQNILPEATENYEQALAIWRELNVPPEQAEALIQLGIIEYRKGNWQRQISFVTQAQGLLEENAEPYRMGKTAAMLAEAFNESGLPEIGLTHYQRALDYFRQTQEPRAPTLMISGIGMTYYLMGNNPEAIRHLQQSLALAAEQKDKLISALCYEYLGRVYSVTREDDLALHNLQSALNLYTNAGNTMESARVRGLLGQIYEQQGQRQQARLYYRQALQTFGNLSDRRNQAALYYRLGGLELKDKNYQAAENYLLQSVEVTEHMRNVSTSRDLMTAFSATVYHRYEKYIECLMRRHEARRSDELVERAFEASELARARSLAELLRSRATHINFAPGLAPDIAEREKSLRHKLSVKKDQRVALLSKNYQKEDLDAVTAELESLEAQYQQVQDIILKLYPAYEQITSPTAWDLRKIQNEVIADDQTILLEYSLGEDKSYVWAVTRNRIASYELPGQAHVNAVAEKFYKLLTTPPEKDAEEERNRAAHELSRLVLSPVAGELNKHRVIVVADGVLNYIPFQVLPAPSAGNEPLVAGYEVINAPSASILGELRKETSQRQPPKKLLAAFGDPVFASNYAHLRDGVEEWSPGNEGLRHALRDIELSGDSFEPSGIRRLFYARQELADLRDVASGGGEVFVASEFDATRDQLLNTDLTQYAILHFATHSLLDPKRPEYSGLVLSTVDRQGHEQNGFVGLQNIYELRAPVDLVVLSACRTGVGKDVRGEGLLSLTRGFMYAGASSVVASLWKVDDEATAELMKQFYTNLLQKRMPPSAALREAQNSIRQRPEWRLPYYWAAFTLHGEYSQVIRQTVAADVKTGYMTA